MVKKNDPSSIAGFSAHKSGDEKDNLSGRYLTVAEVAELMRVSKMTVYRLVHSGELPAVRFGRSFRVNSDQVDIYLQNSYFSAG